VTLIIEKDKNKLQVHT